MAMRVTIALVCLGLLAGLGGVLTGAPAEEPASGKKQDKVDIENVDVWRSAWGGTKTHTLKGNVRLRHADTQLLSDLIEYDEDAKTAVSPGKLTITNPECDISGDNGKAFFDKKLGVIEGNVVMVLKPKESEQDKADADSVRTKLKQPTTIACPKIEYLYGSKVATASGGVSFKQAQRSMTANKAVYDQNKELLTLTGNINGVDEKGQTFSAPGKVVVSLKKGDEWMEAENASASFKIDLGEQKEQ